MRLLAHFSEKNIMTPVLLNAQNVISESEIIRIIRINYSTHSNQKRKMSIENVIPPATRAPRSQWRTAFGIDGSKEQRRAHDTYRDNL